MMRKSVLAASFAALAVATCNPVNAQTAAAETIAAAVADTDRPAQDKARDGERKPAEIVAFAGVQPGHIVAEIAPGGGYYTRILSRAVGPTGKVYALVTPSSANRPGGLDRINALAAQYTNVEVVVTDYAALDLPEPVDLVWTTENYHDIANGDIATVNREVFDALKPGGSFRAGDRHDGHLHAAPDRSGCGDSASYRGGLCAGGGLGPAPQSRRSARCLPARGRTDQRQIRAALPQARQITKVLLHLAHRACKTESAHI
jgi:predicted methyltransferase